MLGRTENERMILVALREIRAMEGNLDRRFGTLAKAPTEQTILSFLSSLHDLETRTYRAERLIEALDRSTDPAPVAA
jgi:hypothetical protein